jgi:cytoskeletal protein CcmA (bactofilin family)
MALFGKGTPRPPDEVKETPAPRAAGIGYMPARGDTVAPVTEAKRAVIGPQIKIQGELSGDEDLSIEGRVEGKISVSKTLRIGAAAQVNAEIRAHAVIVAGRVVGNVSATERIEILPSGSLEGNIRAPKIAIAEGAQFKGSVDMTAKGGPGPSAPVVVATPAAHAPEPKPESRAEQKNETRPEGKQKL